MHILHSIFAVAIVSFNHFTPSSSSNGHNKRTCILSSLCKMNNSGATFATPSIDRIIIYS